MRRRPDSRTWITGLSLALALFGIAHADPEAAPTGELVMSVFVVDERAPESEPLAQAEFRIKSDSDNPFEKIIRTDDQGRASLRLPPGTYTMETTRPIRYKGITIGWFYPTIGIAQGRRTTIELARNLWAERIHDELRDGIVAVEGDSGERVGFVVDRMGLILTSPCFPDEGALKAVRSRKGTRLPTSIVHQDRESNIAVIRIHPEAVRELSVLRLASAGSSSVAAKRQPVLLLGGLTGEDVIQIPDVITQVEGDRITTDSHVGRPYTGSPLISGAREVIGIATATDADSSDELAAYFARLVAIRKAMPALEAARSKLPSLAPLPGGRLPDTPEEEPGR
jgi:S1-C subfamily serine protease